MVHLGGGTAVWRRALVAGLIVFVLAAGLIGIELSRSTATTASWWPAAGVGVIVLFVAPRSWWPQLVVALFVANLLANVIGGRPWDASTCLALADVLETAVVCWGTRRLIGRHLDDLADLGWLTGVSFVGAAVAAVGVALTSSTLLGGDFESTLVSTTGSHWASVVVLAPLGLLPRRTVRHPSRFPVLLHALLLGAVTVFVFGPGSDLALAFVPLPFLIWAGVAYGSRVVVIEQTLMAGAITWLTVGGFGPFTSADHPAGSVSSNLITQLYLVCLVVTGLPLALAVREQLRAHQAVRNEQRRTEAVIDSSTTPIIVTDGSGIVVSANPAVTRLTGFSTSDLVGRHFWEPLFPPSRWEPIRKEFSHPDLVPPSGETVILTASGSERVVTYANGTYRNPDDGGSPQYVLTMTDITEERATQHLLHHLLRSATTVAIVGTDRTGRITVVNAGAEALLRIDASQAIARSFLDFLDHDEIALRGVAARVPIGFDTLVHGVTEDGSQTRDWTWMPPDGVPLVVSMTSSMIADGSDRPIGYLFVARDVTETRRNQELLREALEREQQAVDHLRALDDAKDDFVSTVSHELRTPLTSIIGSIELLEDGMAGQLEPAQQQMIDVIERNAERLLTMANDLLTLASYESVVEPESRLEPLDLRSVVKASHASVTGLLASRQLELRHDLPADPVLVLGESTYLERAVTNLLSNAIKFTRDQGSITTRLSVDDTSCLLSVTDTGVGIPEDEVKDVFQRFFRSSNVRADAIQGTGLGLSIVRSIVERHQGHIDVHSRQGHGTTFTITLPLAAAADRVDAGVSPG